MEFIYTCIYIYIYIYLSLLWVIMDGVAPHQTTNKPWHWRNNNYMLNWNWQSVVVVLLLAWSEYTRWQILPRLCVIKYERKK
jgi:hypothetical protein